MTYFVSYDIAHPKRLRNVAKIIEKYGKLGAAEPMNDPFLIL